MRISVWSSDVCSSDLLVLADLVPRHDSVLVVIVRERLEDGGQVVERALVAPDDELAAGLLLLDPKLADDRRLEHPASDPERSTEERRVGKECDSTWRFRWLHYI